MNCARSQDKWAIKRKEKTVWSNQHYRGISLASRKEFLCIILFISLSACWTVYFCCRLFCFSFWIGVMVVLMRSARWYDNNICVSRSVREIWILCSFSTSIVKALFGYWISEPEYSIANIIIINSFSTSTLFVCCFNTKSGLKWFEVSFYVYMSTSSPISIPYLYLYFYSLVILMLRYMAWVECRQLHYL